MPALVAGWSRSWRQFEATHVNHLGLSGKPDWELADRIVKDEFTFVTNNRVDFIRLFGRMALHAGLIILVPNVTPFLPRALFEAAIQYFNIWRAGIYSIQ